MNPERHSGRDFILLTGLLIIFLIVAFYSEQVSQTVVEQTAASTLNAHPLGTKALYTLFETVPYKVNRLKTSWNFLSSQDGLLVVVEKLADNRMPTAKEVEALRAWTQNGGTLLYFVDLPARALDPKDPLSGDVAILDANDDPVQVAPATRISPYTQQVGTISVASRARLKPAPNSHYDILFADKHGAIVIHKQLGKGHVVLAANTYMVSNRGINEADNVVFLTNVAQATVIGKGSNERNIQFDEYHHGVGFDSAGSVRQTIISTLALPIKRAAWPFLVFLLILIYNANRRFGIALPLTLIPYRPSTDYVLSMARWYRRAGASDIALQTLYHGFLRSLTHSLGVAPDVPITQILALTAQRYPHDFQETSAVVQYCEQLKAGTPLPDAELLAVAHQLEQLKRRVQLVGNQ